MQLPASKKFYWTKHAKEKMRYYQLSAARLMRVLRYPKRMEEGVAEKTLAVMQSAGTKKHPYEVWLMYQKKLKTQNSKVKNKEDDGQQIVIISAWKYPGVTKSGDKVPIPADILLELGMKTDE
ncbi:hypothetical protein A2V95_00640 [Candidatus Kuenenbacteria bacterium RBG_16_41_7]|uniref:Uncharacterized protein n=1 Tax=Candidatus Kuenenbacteria bacterium RBG_16_41_7 TaxID=1798560 RepID=A0A1F6GC85_9BACT|nr:MAG: hypothetical protein A2V95_00640 [Candidatus Kuenenbacteria bacterium RBG_16_41_7]